MATIRIDGRSYQVEAGQNLLQACLSLGLDLPYFCWHPALGSVGACRQCALVQYQNEEDQRGRLVMGCMTPVADGQLLSIKAENAVAFRAGIIESLMTNHPHDCPVCEEGGECHLQDMTVMSGHHRRRYRGLKRTFRNQQLGPFINHEMNRCITCYRCLRFYRDYAGGTDLHALASRNHTYFGRFEDGPLESGFAGNLVEVCPTGVFTDKPLSSHYSRKWDLQCAPSLCVHCSLGCNISPGERYGVLRRVQNRYHHAINGYFLCDRGRFGYGHLNHPRRPRQPVLRKGEDRLPIDRTEAIARLRQLLTDTQTRWIGIGSPRATLESNRALQRLVGEDHFFAGVSGLDEQLNQQLYTLMGGSGWRVPSLREIESADALLILGEDIGQSAPRMALSVRQAVRARGRERAAELKIPPWQDQAVQIAGQDAHHPLYLSHAGPTDLDALALTVYRGTALEQARLGFAVAHALCPEAPAVPALEEEQRRLAEAIAGHLRDARQPLLVCGTGAGEPALLEATGQILRALCAARLDQAAPPWLAPVFAECNSLGLTLLNGANHENSLDTALELAATGRVGAIILENDLFLRAPSARVDAFFRQLSHSVAIDCLYSATVDRAELVLPATGFAETQGTLVNNEGRAQALYPVYPPDAALRPGWRWLSEASSGPLSLSQLQRECGEQCPPLAALAGLYPDPDRRFGSQKLARMPHRGSGRTAMNAAVSVHEPRQPQDSDSVLAYSMEGLPATALQRYPEATGLMPYSWAPGWNSNQSVHRFQQEVNGPLRGGDSGLRLAWQRPPADWLTPPPRPEAPPTGQLLAQPQPRLFGGEELSGLAAPVVERAGRPRLRLHPTDAEALGIAAGDRVELGTPEGSLMLPVKLDPRVARGLVLVPQPFVTLRGAATVTGLGPEPVIASDRESDDD